MVDIKLNLPRKLKDRQLSRQGKLNDTNILEQVILNTETAGEINCKCNEMMLGGVVEGQPGELVLDACHHRAQDPRGCTTHQEKPGDTDRPQTRCLLSISRFSEAFSTFAQTCLRKKHKNFRKARAQNRSGSITNIYWFACLQHF